MKLSDEMEERITFLKNELKKYKKSKIEEICFNIVINEITSFLPQVEVLEKEKDEMLNALIEIIKNNNIKCAFEKSKCEKWLCHEKCDNNCIGYESKYTQLIESATGKKWSEINE